MPNLVTRKKVKRNPKLPSTILVIIKVFCLPNPFKTVRATWESPKNIIEGISITINFPASSCLKKVFAKKGAKNKTKMENTTVMIKEIKNEDFALCIIIFLLVL